MLFFLWFTYIAQFDWLKMFDIAQRGITVAFLTSDVIQ